MTEAVYSSGRGSPDGDLSGDESPPDPIDEDIDNDSGYTSYIGQNGHDNRHTKTRIKDQWNAVGSRISRLNEMIDFVRQTSKAGQESMKKESDRRHTLNKYPRMSTNNMDKPEQQIDETSVDAMYPYYMDLGVIDLIEEFVIKTPACNSCVRALTTTILKPGVLVSHSHFRLSARSKAAMETMWSNIVRDVIKSLLHIGLAVGVWVNDPVVGQIMSIVPATQLIVRFDVDDSANYKYRMWNRTSGSELVDPIVFELERPLAGGFICSPMQRVLTKAMELELYHMLHLHASYRSAIPPMLVREVPYVPIKTPEGPTGDKSNSGSESESDTETISRYGKKVKRLARRGRTREIGGPFSTGVLSQFGSIPLKTRRTNMNTPSGRLRARYTNTDDMDIPVLHTTNADNQESFLVHQPFDIRALPMSFTPPPDLEQKASAFFVDVTSQFGVPMSSVRSSHGKYKTNDSLNKERMHRRCVELGQIIEQTINTCLSSRWGDVDNTNVTSLSSNMTMVMEGTGPTPVSQQTGMSPFSSSSPPPPPPPPNKSQDFILGNMNEQRLRIYTENMTDEQLGIDEVLIAKLTEMVEVFYNANSITAPTGNRGRGAETGRANRPGGVDRYMTELFLHEMMIHGHTIPPRQTDRSPSGSQFITDPLAPNHPPNMGSLMASQESPDPTPYPGVSSKLTPEPEPEPRSLQSEPDPDPDSECADDESAPEPPKRQRLTRDSKRRRSPRGRGGSRMNRHLSMRIEITVKKLVVKVRKQRMDYAFMRFESLRHAHSGTDLESLLTPGTDKGGVISGGTHQTSVHEYHQQALSAPPLVGVGSLMTVGNESGSSTSSAVNIGTNKSHTSTEFNVTDIWVDDIVAGCSRTNGLYVSLLIMIDNRRDTMVEYMNGQNERNVSRVQLMKSEIELLKTRQELIRLRATVDAEESITDTPNQ